MPQDETITSILGALKALQDGQEALGKSTHDTLREMLELQREFKGALLELGQRIEALEAAKQPEAQ